MRSSYGLHHWVAGALEAPTVFFEDMRPARVACELVCQLAAIERCCHDQWFTKLLSPRSCLDASLSLQRSHSLRGEQHAALRVHVDGEIAIAHETKFYSLLPQVAIVMALGQFRSLPSWTSPLALRCMQGGTGA